MNAQQHPLIYNFNTTEIIFLLTKTTAKLQPIDQVVARSLKAYNKSLLIQKLFETINKEKDFPVFSILDAMKMFNLGNGQRLKIFSKPQDVNITINDKSKDYWLQITLLPRQHFTCSKSAIETSKQFVKYIQNYNKDTRVTS